MDSVVRGPQEEYTREVGGGMEETVYVMGGERCRPLFLGEGGGGGDCDGEESDATSCTDDGRDYGEDIQAQIDRLDANLSHIESMVDPTGEDDGDESEVLLESGGHALPSSRPLGSRIFGRRRQSPRIRGIIVEDRPRGVGAGAVRVDVEDRGGMCGRTSPQLIMFGLAALLFGVAAALQVMQFYKWELRGMAKAFVADIPPRGVMEIHSRIEREEDNLYQNKDKLHW